MTKTLNTKLSEFFITLRTGDALYLEIEGMLLLRGFNLTKETFQLAEPHLAEELSRLQAAGVRVYGLTKQDASEHNKTIEQLKSLDIVLTKVLHIPTLNLNDNRISSSKGAVLRRSLESLVGNVAPKRVIVVDEDEAQLADINRECVGYPLNLYKYKRPQRVLVFEKTSQQFPNSLESYSQPRLVNATATSTYVIEQASNGKKLILKNSPHSNAFKIEILCKALYRVLGVTVLDQAVYDELPPNLSTALNLTSAYGTFLVSELIEKSHALKNEENCIRSLTRTRFITHAVMGHTDAANVENFITDANNTIYLITAGSNFVYRADGEEANDNNDVLSELESMLTSSSWFAGMTETELCNQARLVLAKQVELNAIIWDFSEKLGMPSELRDQFIAGFARRLSVLADRFHVPEQTLAQPDKPAILSKTAAGILTYALIDGSPHVLLSQREGGEGWDCFGGQSECSAIDPSLLHTALREVKEESSELLIYSEYDLQHAPFHDLLSMKAGSLFTYRMYLVEHAAIDTNHLRDPEHVQHKWVPVQHIMKALKQPSTTLVNKQDTCTVSLPESKDALNLYPPFYQMLTQKQVLGHLERLASNRQLKPTHTRGYSGEQAPKQVHAGIIDTPKTRREKMANALIARSAVMRELKHTLKPKPFSEQPATTTSTNHSPSEFYMRNFLGSQWEEGNLAGNVSAMLVTFFSASYDPLTEIEKNQLLVNCVNLIEHEKQTAGEQVHFYHGCDDKISFAYEMYTALYEVLHASNNWPVFRAKGGIFTQYASMAEFIAHFFKGGNIDDSATDFNEYGLSTNVFLFGNHPSNSCCSMFYMLTNFAGRNINLQAVLENVLHPFGIDASIITKMIHLHGSFAAKRAGALYQIGMSRDDAKRLTYAAASAGLENPYRGSLCVPDILDQLLDANAQIGPAEIGYIKDLQARLLASPLATFSVKLVRLRELSEKEMQTYAHQRKVIVDELAHSVLSALAPFNQDELAPGLALPRMQKTLVRNYQLPKAVDTPVQLATAISKNDALQVANLLQIHPEWRDVPLSMKSAYANRNLNFFKPSRKMKALNVMLYHSKLQTDLIEAWYGEDWLNHPTLVVSDIDELILLVRRVEKQDRLSIINKYISLLRNATDLFSIIPYLPKSNQSSFIKNHRDKLLTCDQYGTALGWLNDDEQLAYAETLGDKIANGTDLAHIVASIPVNARLSFAKRYSGKIKTSHECRLVVEELKPEEQLIFLEWHLDKFNETNDVLTILNSLQGTDRLPFLVKIEDKIIHDGFICRLIMDDLPVNTRLILAEKHAQKIKDARELTMVLYKIPENSQLTFLKNQLQKIESVILSSKALQEVLTCFSVSDRCEAATLLLLKIEELNAFDDVLKGLPTADQLTLTKSWENRRKSCYDPSYSIDLIETFIGIPI